MFEKMESEQKKQIHHVLKQVEGKHDLFFELIELFDKLFVLYSELKKYMDKVEQVGKFFFAFSFLFVFQNKLHFDYFFEEKLVVGDAQAQKNFFFL